MNHLDPMEILNRALAELQRCQWPEGCVREPTTFGWIGDEELPLCDEHRDAADEAINKGAEK